MPLTRRLLGPLPVIFCLILRVTGGKNDSYIETEPSVNLQRGTMGRLPCTVKQQAYSVSWWKSASSGSDEQLLIQLDIFFSPGDKIGTGFDQGLFDITDDFSLIIKNVQLPDAGEYVCDMEEFTTAQAYRDETIVTVSDIAGTNDVSYIETEPLVNLQRGILGLLTCTVKQPAYSVSWWKLSPSGSTERLLIHLDKFYHLGNITGSGYEEGFFDITDNSSLIIKNVELSDAAIYFCLMGDLVTGQFYRVETNVTVFAPPSKPFPFIRECVKNGAYDKDDKECIITTLHISISLTCRVDNYYPYYTLSFTHKYHNVDGTNSRKWENSDGSYSKSLTITAKRSSEPYLCIATGKDETGNVITTSTKIMVNVDGTTLLITLLTTIISSIGVVVLFIPLYMLYKWARSADKIKEDLIARVNYLLDIFETADNFPTKVFVDIEEYESKIDKGDNIKLLLADYLIKNERNFDYNKIFRNLIAILFPNNEQRGHTCGSSIEDVETDQDLEKQYLRGNGNACTPCILDKNLECVLSCFCCLTDMSLSACNEMEQNGCLQQLFYKFILYMGHVPPSLLKRLARLIFNCSRKISCNILFNKNAIKCIKKFLAYDNNEIKTLAYMSLFNISDEYVDAKLCVNFFLEKLKAFQENKQILQMIHGFTLLELMEGLDGFASDEEGSLGIVENNGINLLEEVLKDKHRPESYQEKYHFARIIWQLALNADFRDDVKEKRHLLTINFAEHREPSAIPFRNACVGALFVIDGMDDQGDNDQVQERQHIFICCPRDNNARGRMLKELVISKGYTVRHSNRTIEEYNHEEMIKDVKRSSVVVACLTKGVKECPFCRTEMTYAKKLGKVIIPVTFEEGYTHHTEKGWLRDVIEKRACYNFFNSRVFEQNFWDLRVMGQISP